MSRLSTSEESRCDSLAITPSARSVSRAFDSAGAKQFAEQADLRERRAKLVRRAGDEIGAQPRQLALAPHTDRARAIDDREHEERRERAEDQRLDDDLRPERAINSLVSISRTSAQPGASVGCAAYAAAR